MRTPILLLCIAWCTATFANPVHDQVLALSESQRQDVFARQLQRTGERCPSVSRTFYQGSSKDDAAFWSVACVGGKDWQFMLRSDGSMRYVECSVIKAVSAGKCFTRFKP